VAFLDELHLEDVDLVGHSLGGAIAAQIALDHPQRVRSLSLLAPAGFGEEINGDFINAFASAQTRRDLKAALGQLFADDSLVSRALVDGVLRYKRLDGVGEVLETLSGTLFPDGRQATQLASRLGGLPAPLMVIWGTDDRVIPARHAANAPARAKVVTIARTGHMVQMENP